MRDSDNYEVGFGKPPKTSQFKKGQSGNPMGRPKGRLNVSTLIHQLLEEKVMVVEKGQERSVQMMEVILRRMVNKAATGDLKAIPMVLSLVDRALAGEEGEVWTAESDQLHIHSALLRMRQGLLRGDGLQEPSK